MTEDISPTAQDYADLFEVDRRGVRILEDLILRFVHPSVSKGGIDAILQTYDRMGQRKPLDFIMSQINRSHGIDVQDEEQ